MTRRSPCLTCTDVGPDKDKSSHTCMMCYRRIEYVRAIGEMTHTLDIEEASVSKKAICKTAGCSGEATPSGYCKRCQGRNWYRVKHGIPIDAPLDKARSIAAIKSKEGEKQVEETVQYEKAVSEDDKKRIKSEIAEWGKENSSYGDSFTEVIGVMKKSTSNPVQTDIPESEGYDLNIDLTSYPEIHNYFIKKATEELRTIPNQILWTLLQIVRGER